MVRYQTRTSDDTESTRSPAKINMIDLNRKILSFDEEEGTTHVDSGDSIGNHAKKTQVTCFMKESRFKVQSRYPLPATHLELHVNRMVRAKDTPL